MDDIQIMRVLSHGKITDLSSGFSKKVPFSVYVRPLNTTMDSDVKIRCKCICDEELSDLPVAFYDWTPAAIVEIAPTAISLENYEVFWGAGNPNI